MPDTTSGLRVEALASSGKIVAGRRLAKSPRCLRSPRMACSGRRLRSRVSYFGSPTEPNRIASASFASDSVAGGSGCPDAA
jgi:hypothetical protein